MEFTQKQANNGSVGVISVFGKVPICAARRVRREYQAVLLLEGVHHQITLSVRDCCLIYTGCTPKNAPAATKGPQE
jgi:hypothetical protein